MKSVLQNSKECIICGNPKVHEHHIFFGTANRDKSEEHGLKVCLCPKHHNMSNEGVHFNRELDLALKIMAQKHYEKYIGTREQFRREFGKSWL